MIVLDASAAVELLKKTDRGEQVAQRIFAPGETLHAPHLLDLEVAQVLRRHVAQRYLSAEQGQGALDYWSAMSIERHPHDPYLARIWDLRHAFTAYDAAYVSLAEALEATLLTCDRKMLAAGHEARIELVAHAAQA